MRNQGLARCVYVRARILRAFSCFSLIIGLVLLLLLLAGLRQSLATPSSFEYHVLNPRIQSVPMQVMSLSDGNQIQVDGVSMRLDRYARETISAGASLEPGTRITGTGPFTLGSEAKGADLPVPGLFAGAEFVIPHHRDHHYYYLLSPHGDARVEIVTTQDPVLITLPKGEMVVFDAGNDNTRAGIIRSDRPILVEHAAYSGTVPRDAYPVPPVSRNLWGIRSNIAVVAAIEDGTTISVYSSNGEADQYSLNAGEKRRISIGQNGLHGSG
ncbi:MAG TPA: hypothetical protein VLA26_03820, partial [Gammaproteobacteria bacterium]|nr:hypothetical protein [Gammaproteobacteria bacterium]